MAGTGTIRNVQGNHACALGAIAAGCRFFAGYPITPSSEVAERMARELPGVKGVFIQMEDEIASMGAVIGASLGGVKAMTATSGPGFSLMQENIGYAAQTETPCVIVNVMRGGPSTGMPTRPSQGDIMQARWGTHGDHPVIVLAPASVKEVYDEMIRAFGLAERLRVPVIVLFDEVIGHLLESVELAPPATGALVGRKWAHGPGQNHRPGAAGDDMVPAMARPGDGYRAHTTGLTHDETGFPTQDPVAVDRFLRRLLGKIDYHRATIESYETVATDDAGIVVAAIGVTSRAARRAVKTARDEGIKAGLFRPITLWPFPTEPFLRAARRAKAVLVPEMNAGQMCLEIERICPDSVSVVPLGRIDGEPISPDEILAAIRKIGA
jgi:2-oxoglutarate ferredoxin oxidoreductase subunit alpha